MRKLALLVAVLLVLALGAVAKGSTVEVACGPTVTTPLTVRGVHAGQKAGATLRRMQDGDISEWDAVMAVKGVLDTIALWYSSLHHAANDLPEDQVVTGWKTRTKEAQEQALASCCLPATPLPSDPAPPIPPQGEPFDPKTASLRRGFTDEQLSIARQAVRVADERGIPQRGKVVILATGFQESRIRNLTYGDRDSIGWLQQRPSQGWGSTRQIMDPAYGAGKFFDHLVRVDGWESMPVTVAAQRVQRSGFPNAYAKWEDDAVRLLASVGQGARPPAPNPTTPAPVACAPAAPPASAPQPPVVSADFSQYKNPRTPEQAIAYMQNQGRITPNKCLAYVRGAYGWGHSVNGTNAKDRWYTTPTSLRHPGDWNAPRGALLVWGIREGHPGHIAISLGDGTIISTDVPRNGAIGVRPASYYKGYGQYLGWIPPYFDGQTTITEGASA